MENDSISSESEDNESDYTNEERSKESCEEERSKRLPPYSKRHSYYLRSKRNYPKKATMKAIQILINISCKEDIQIINTHICNTQISVMKVIKVFGDKAMSAIKNKYEQMDSLNLFQSLHFKNMPLNQKTNILNIIDLIEE